MEEQDQIVEEQLDAELDQLDSVSETEEKKRKKGGIIALVLLLLLVVLVATTAGVYLNYLLGRLGTYDPSNNITLSPDQMADILDKDPALTPINPEEELPGIEELPKPSGGETIEKEKDVVNILIVGQDSNNAASRSLSDTMILVTVHTKAKQVTLTSFLRDAYVDIPGFAANKLNHAYLIGGLKLLNETLKVNFGVEVDGNVIIDFSSFKQVIDMLGGVDISLTRAEAVYLREGCRHDVQEGMNRLNGEEALNYARLREIDSDYQRTNRQRKLILSLIDRYKSLPLDQMLAVLDDILPLIVTDMDKTQILDYAIKCGPVAASASYGTQQIPALGTFDEGYFEVREGLKNWFQYNIDFDRNCKILEKIMTGNR